MDLGVKRQIIQNKEATLLSLYHCQIIQNKEATLLSLYHCGVSLSSECCSCTSAVIQDHSKSLKTTAK